MIRAVQAVENGPQEPQVVIDALHLVHMDTTGLDALEQLHAALHRRGIATRPGTHAVHLLGYYRDRFGLAPDDYPAARDCDTVFDRNSVMSGPGVSPRIAVEARARAEKRGTMLRIASPVGRFGLPMRPAKPKKPTLNRLPKSSNVSCGQPTTVRRAPNAYP